MSSDEFGDWVAFFQFDPFGTYRSDVQAGIIAATIANAMSTAKGRRYKPADFMPQFGQQSQQPMSELEILAVFKRVAGQP